MALLRRFLTLFKPSPREWALFGFMWMKLLVFYTLLFNSDQRNFSLECLNHEIFRSLLRPAYFSLAILLALSVLNAAPARRRALVYLGLSGLTSLVLLADLWYYRAFRTIPSFRLLGVTQHTFLSLDMVVPFMRPQDALLFLDAVLGWRLLRQDASGPRWNRLAVQGCGFLALYLLVAPLALNVIGSSGASFVFERHKPLESLTTLSPLGYHLLDLAATVKERLRPRPPLTAPERAEIAAWLEANREHLPPGPDFGRCRGRNLLVIQVESLEAFPIDQRVNGQEITPNLNALKRRGLFFANYHEQVREGVSSDGDLMTNSSILPVLRNPTFIECPVASLPSLPRTLAGAGYHTLSIHPDPGSVWNAMSGLTQLGFQRRLDSSAFVHSVSFAGNLADEALLEQTAPILLGQARPFYAFMVTLSSHMPFKLPASTRDLALDPELDREPMGGYLQAVHYTDKHLGRFLARLDAAGLLDDTVVAITGDHQGIHKYLDAEVARSRFREPWWGGRDCRLPLLIVAKGLSPRVLDLQAGQVDLMPTLLGLLGVEPPPGLMGRDLLNTRRNVVVLADGSILGDAGPELQAHLAASARVADLALHGDYFALPHAERAAR